MASARDRNVGGGRLDVAAQARKIHSWIQNADFDEPRPRDCTADGECRQVHRPGAVGVGELCAHQEAARPENARRSKAIARAAQRQAEDSARRAIRENLAAIDAGEADELLADIEAEYGADFVTAELERARADADAELGGAPEPNDYNPSATAHANGTPEADPAPPTVTVDPDPTPAAPAEADSTEPVTTRPRARTRGLAAIARVPEPVRSLLICLWVLLRYSPDPAHPGGPVNA
ncbi:MAG: hypothetical protein U5J98_07020 [Halobacteriales archaeon]|nr:hypothetical protein [Halobacteriales archaeon]